MFKSPGKDSLYQADFLDIRQCKRGVFGFYKTDTVQGRALAHYGELYDPQISVLLELLEGDDLVIDVGAGIGAYTVPLARKLLVKGGVVHAFEPARLNHQMMVMNVALNRLVNVFDYRMAVGKEPGQAKAPLMNPLKGQDFARLPNVEGQGDQIQVLALDQLGLERCKLIKIDANGSEMHVLNGARDLITRLQPALFMAYAGNLERHGWVFDLLDAFDYQAWWHFADLYQPKNFQKFEENLFSDMKPDVNLLALPKAAGAQFPNMIPTGARDEDWDAALARGRETQQG
ncbi:MAG: FkbM family methyltransferase [Pseudomonadota bacterium]